MFMTGVEDFQLLHAQPKISIEVEPHEITIGDPVELTIRVRTDGYRQVILPSPSNLSPFEILKVDTLKTSKNEVF